MKMCGTVFVDFCVPGSMSRFQVKLGRHWSDYETLGIALGVQKMQPMLANAFSKVAVSKPFVDDSPLGQRKTRN